MLDTPCRKSFPALEFGFPPIGEKRADRIRAYARRSQTVADKPGKQRGISRRSSIYNRFYGRRSAVLPSVFPLTGRVLLDGDRIDLDLRTHRQLGYLIADACGHILRKERGVNGVHRGEIGDNPSKLILMLCTIPLCVTCGKLTNRLTRKVKQKKRL